MNDSKISKIAGLGLPVAGLTALLLLGTLMATTEKADANPAMASKTGKGCPVCHTSGATLNNTGKKYKQTGKL